MDGVDDSLQIFAVRLLDDEVHLDVTSKVIPALFGPERSVPAQSLFCLAATISLPILVNADEVGA